MTQADIHTTAKERLDEVRSELSDLEPTFLEARNLAYVARMLGSSDEMPKGPGGALDTLADTLLAKLDELIKAREHIWELAGEAVL